MKNRSKKRLRKKSKLRFHNRQLKGGTNEYDANIKKLFNYFFFYLDSSKISKFYNKLKDFLIETKNDFEQAKKNIYKYIKYNERIIDSISNDINIIYYMDKDVVISIIKSSESWDDVIKSILPFDSLHSQSSTAASSKKTMQQQSALQPKTNIKQDEPSDLGTDSRVANVSTVAKTVANTVGAVAKAVGVGAVGAVANFLKPKVPDVDQKNIQKLFKYFFPYLDSTKIPKIHNKLKEFLIKTKNNFEQAKDNIYIYIKNNNNIIKSISNDISEIHKVKKEDVMKIIEDSKSWDDVKKYIILLENVEQNAQNVKLRGDLISLFIELNKQHEPNKTVDISDINLICPFNRDTQQDSHELLLKYINSLKQYNIFNITETSTITCNTTNQTGRKLIITNHLQIPNGFKNLPIQASLDIPLVTNHTYLESCNGPARQEISYINNTKYLLIQLKIFNNDGIKQPFIKPIDTSITFNGEDYTLMGYIAHTGSQINHGHYVYVDFSGKYTIYNDDTIIVDQPHQPNNTKYNPYVVLYVKTGQGSPFNDVRAGIKNIGSTCYISAALQLLASIPELRR